MQVAVAAKASTIQTWAVPHARPPATAGLTAAAAAVLAQVWQAVTKAVGKVVVPARAQAKSHTHQAVMTQPSMVLVVAAEVMLMTCGMEQNQAPAARAIKVLFI